MATESGVRKIELLSPAKNLACGIAAVNHGADAVYIGGPGFSARAAAANSIDDIARLVDHAHLFGVRVYVALNTIFDDEELQRAVALCHTLYGIGVDALIIQDTGLLQSDLPPIALHASTQMDNRTPEKVRFWQDVGIEQVVLARELHLEQIREISANCSVPLEFFVHGALCVSYSGQCYISEVVAGRSANRGKCAQFCRHKFDLKNSEGTVLAKESYLLSLKDLNLSQQLQALIDAGISSLKIEGRLKDENYVKNITAYYRTLLDGIIASRDDLAKASSGSCSFGFTPDPDKSFNRGSSEYFTAKKRNIVGDIRSPKSKGKFLGRVVGIDKQSFSIDTDQSVENGDGLCFFDGKQSLVGFRVNRADGIRLFPQGDPRRLGLKVGMELYRNVDTLFEKQLMKSDTCRSIDLDLVLTEQEDGLQLTVTDVDGITSITQLAAKTEEAKNPEAVRNTAIKQLRKSGGTFFCVTDVQVKLAGRTFYPAATFNEVRRSGFSRHAEERKKYFRSEPRAPRADTGVWPAKKVDYRDNIKNRKALQFYMDHGVDVVDEPPMEAAATENPRLMTTKYCVKAQLGGCPKMKGGRHDMEGSLSISDNTGEYSLEFDCKKCQMLVRQKKD